MELCEILKLNRTELVTTRVHGVLLFFEEVENPLRIIYYKRLIYVSSTAGTIRIIDMRKSIQSKSA